MERQADDCWRREETQNWQNDLKRDTKGLQTHTGIHNDYNYTATLQETTHKEEKLKNFNKQVQNTTDTQQLHQRDTKQPQRDKKWSEKNNTTVNWCTAERHWTYLMMTEGKEGFSLQVNQPDTLTGVWQVSTTRPLLLLACQKTKYRWRTSTST